jgi:hypothetical protein
VGAPIRCGGRGTHGPHPGRIRGRDALVAIGPRGAGWGRAPYQVVVVAVVVVVALLSGTIEGDWAARMITVRVEVAVRSAGSVTT